MKKYALFPGRVRSINDGDIHYINERKLAQLYGVDLSECVVIHGDSYGGELPLVPLRPRYDGNYSL